MVNKLSEDDIKVITLRFLRDYYKFFRRKRDLQHALDLRGGGVVADGLLSFERDDGSTYTITFEATSADVQEEVRYRINEELLGWDAVATTAIMVTFVYTLSYLTRIFAVPDITLITRIVTIMLFGLAVFMIYRWVGRKFRRYRYIYAVEQFKHYHADEQWISVGWDVFEDPVTDPGFRELRRQCILHGFGMIVVGENKRAKAVIAPSMLDQFNEKRKVILLDTLSGLGKRFRFGKGESNKKMEDYRLWKWLQPYIRDSYFRFNRMYYHQWALTLTGAIAFSILFAQEWNRLPMRYVDEWSYNRRLERMKDTLEPESQVLYIDAPIIPFGQVDSVPLFKIGDSLYGELSATGGNTFFFDPLRDSVVAFDCKFLLTIDTTHYMIQALSVTDWSTTLGLIRYLTDRGFTVNAMSLDCFKDARKGYLIYFDPLLTDSLEAIRMARLYERRLSKLEEDWPEPLIVPLIPKVDSTAQKPKPPRVPDSLKRDSLRRDSVKVDTVRRDSGG